MSVELDSVVRQALPPASGDGIYNLPRRVTKYGESIIRILDASFEAEQGNKHVATNPTMGTGIATTTSIQTYDATKPVMLVQNAYGIGGPSIIFDYLRLLATAVGGSTTSFDWVQVLDPLPSGRYTSGGSQITPQPLNTKFGKSGALIYFGAVVSPAAGANARFVHRSKARSVIPVVGDEWLFKFGSQNHEGPTTLGGAVALRMPTPCGPVVLNPGDTWLLHGFGAASAGAPAWEFELGYTER
jgi:hypothetical protein